MASLGSVVDFVLSAPWTLAISTAAIILYNSNRIFRFYCKLCFYYFLIVLLCTIVLPLTAMRPRNVTNTNLVSVLMTACCWLLYGIKWKFVNEQYLGATEPGVVVGNHQSAIDVLGMMAVWPRLYRCVSMVKSELRYALSFGLLCYFCGTVFIDRAKPGKARETMTKTVDYLKSKNTKVYIFPEGTRNSGADLLPFKKGAFHLAVQGQMPIYPVVFSEYSHVYNYEKKVFQPGTITVIALPAISTKGLTTEDVNELTERVRKQMLDVLQEKGNTNEVSKSTSVNGDTR